MAIIKKGLLSGRVGNVVYKVVNGRSVVSSYPRRKKGEFEPKEQHGRFALATKISSRIYKQLKDFNLNLVSSDLYNNLVKFFINEHAKLSVSEPRSDWEQIGVSEDLPTTKGALPRHIFRGTPLMKFEDGHFVVYIPRFESGHFLSNGYRMPRGIVALQSAITIIHYNFESESAQVVYNWQSDRYTIGGEYPLLELIPDVDGKGELFEGGLLLAALNIRTYGGTDSVAYINHKGFNPSMVMGVWTKS